MDQSQPLSVDTASVLVVDDEELNRDLLEALLVPEGYEVIPAKDGEKALAIVAEQRVDIVLLDVMMPGLDGIEVCRRIRRDHDTAHLPVIIVTALNDRESRVRGKEAGCDDFLVKPVDKNEVLVRTKNLLLIKLYQESIEGQNLRLEEAVNAKTAELRRALRNLELAEERVRLTREEIVHRLARAAEFRDDETAQHVQRMAHYCRLIAEKLGWDNERCEKILVASPMHDVGKIGTPDHILLKPGKLTKAEFEIMKEHAEIGFRILTGSQTELLQMGASIAISHHEKWDGSGYPKGLRGEEIPVEGRIAAVADVFDALMSRRVYKDAFPLEKSVGIMKESRGQHFDSEVVNVFLDAMDQVLAIKEKFPDRA